MDADLSEAWRNVPEAPGAAHRLDSALVGGQQRVTGQSIAASLLRLFRPDNGPPPLNQGSVVLLTEEVIAVVVTTDCELDGLPSPVTDEVKGNE